MGKKKRSRMDELKQNVAFAKKLINSQGKHEFSWARDVPVKTMVNVLNHEKTLNQALVLLSLSLHIPVSWGLFRTFIILSFVLFSASALIRIIKLVWKMKYSPEAFEKP